MTHGVLSVDVYGLVESKIKKKNPPTQKAILIENYCQGIQFKSSVWIFQVQNASGKVIIA